MDLISSLIDLIIWVVKGIVSLVSWLLSNLFDLVVWIAKGLFDLVKLVAQAFIWGINQFWEIVKPGAISIFEWYKAIILMNPFENFLLWVMIGIIFFFWNKITPTMPTSKLPIYKRPKVIITLAVPTFTALLGVLMPDDKKEGGVTWSFFSGNKTEIMNDSHDNTYNISGNTTNINANSNNSNLNSENTSTSSETNNSTTNSTTNRSSKSIEQSKTINNSVLQNSSVELGGDNANIAK